MQIWAFAAPWRACSAPTSQDRPLRLPSTQLRPGWGLPSHSRCPSSPLSHCDSVQRSNCLRTRLGAERSSTAACPPCNRYGAWLCACSHSAWCARWRRLPPHQMTSPWRDAWSATSSKSVSRSRLSLGCFASIAHSISPSCGVSCSSFWRAPSQPTVSLNPLFYRACATAWPSASSSCYCGLCSQILRTTATITRIWFSAWGGACMSVPITWDLFSCAS